MTSISIKFELQPCASVDVNHEAAQHFEDVFAVCNLVGVLESFTTARNDLGKPSIALSPDLYHRITTMQWADRGQTVAQVLLQQAPHVSALTAEYGPPARELEQVYLERADLTKQVLALRHALANERKAHAEERAKLRTALETCLEMVQDDDDPPETEEQVVLGYGTTITRTRIEKACKEVGLSHAGYNDGEPIYFWEKT